MHPVWSVPTHAGAEPGTRDGTPVRVLIADDSGFFRRRIVERLDGDPLIEVVASVENGLEAVNEVRRLRPAVVVMDIEMPVMNGIDAVRRIMRETPTPVIVFSSQTSDGARITLDALEAGAVDYLSKSSLQDRACFARVVDDLRHRIHVVGGCGLPARPSAARTLKERPPRVAESPTRRTPELVVIGASTGGPVALQRILTSLPAEFPSPVLLVQHMPATFTPAFATRLDGMSALNVRQAGEGDRLCRGTVLLAPGGCQISVAGRRGAVRVHLREARTEEHYRPSVDLALYSAADVLGGAVLGIILTGMGADGREGARALKSRGAEIWVQDRDSCVVYGMPAAVAQAGLADRVLPLNEIGSALRLVG